MDCQKHGIKGERSLITFTMDTVSLYLLIYVFIRIFQILPWVGFLSRVICNNKPITV